MSRALIGVATLGCLAAAFWGWTIWSVYFAGGPSEFTEPQPGDPLEVIALADGFSLIKGAGGNITVMDGEDGLLIIDTGYKQMAPQVLATLREISETPLITIVNTHGHDDHSGGNVAIAGETVQIAAHSWTLSDVHSAYGAEFLGVLPNVVVENRHEFEFNGQKIRLIHVPFAHTAGDIIAVFEPANIIVTGDAFYTNMLPYLSTRTGATIDGHLSAQTLIVALSDADTRIIPGHGDVTDRSGAAEVNRDLQRIRDRLAWSKRTGLPREAALLLHPLRGWPASRQLDGDWEKFWVGIVWETLP